MSEAPEQKLRPPMTGSDILAMIIAAIGSLKVTVTLLAMSMCLVFAGTVAQIDKGIWSVVEDYFRCFIAWVELRIFLPRSQSIPEWLVIPFPGGWTIGGALVLNLAVSHAARIKVQARGGALAVGAGVLAAGVGLTWWVIGHVFDGDSSEATLSPTWRVTVQLIQGGGAAAVLFTGCKLLFKRKAGIVLLHGGILLMMLSELFTGLYAEESMMTIYEGQKVNFAEDTREVELAVIDGSDEKEDDVIVIPESRLLSGKPVNDEALPFVVEVLEGKFFKNSQMERWTPGKGNPATHGTGVSIVAEEAPEESGVDSAGRVDESAAYVKVTDAKTNQALGTYLVAVRFSRTGSPQKVTVGGKTYDVYMRFKRIYKPYALYLYDFRYEKYPGTTTPKDYSSYVKLLDDERETERDVRIWMNNPLRYRGDTLYQSSFDPSEAGTVLQVVENEGWMVPYVGCMIVMAGLLGQFLLHLTGFLKKRFAA